MPPSISTLLSTLQAASSLSTASSSNARAAGTPRRCAIRTVLSNSFKGRAPADAVRSGPANPFQPFRPIRGVLHDPGGFFNFSQFLFAIRSPSKGLIQDPPHDLSLRYLLSLRHD